MYNLSDYTVTSTARCSAEVDGSWSSKGDRQPAPHASTLDAIIMANAMAQHYCQDVLGYSDAEIARLYPARVAVRAGSEPAPIDSLSLSANLEHIPGASPAELIFRVTVANLEVRLTLVEVDPSQFGKRLFGDGPSIGGVCRPRETVVEDLVLTDDATQIEATAYVQKARESHAQCGLGQRVSDWMQLSEALLISAQICQVMIYQHDQIDRAESENLWMRRIDLELFPHEPLSPGEPTVIKGSIDRVTDVSLGETVFRTFRVSGGSDHLRCTSNIAHALPQRTMAELMREIG